MFRSLRRRRATRKLRVEQLDGRCLPSANIVFEWTDLLLAVSGPGTPTTAARNQGNQIASRSMAMMHAAIYDAVNAIDRTHTVYHVAAQAPAGTSAEAAAAQAAHDVAVGLYNRPAEVALFDATLAADLAAIPDGQAETDGIALGQSVASQILTWRAGDHSTDPASYQLRNEPGQWQPTPPNFTQTPVTPQWPNVTPFALTTGDQFRPGPPPALTSADYTEAFQQVKALGGNGTTTPSARTPDQTEMALFWGIAPTNGGVAVWNRIAETVAAERGNTLAENARLFAQLNVTVADSFIAGFDAKYAYNFWRPVTAIRAADTDGNPDTTADPTWTPLITTPNHQSYVALHASQSESAAQTLASFFGDRVHFTVTNSSLPGAERSFDRFTEAAHEAGKSRIYGGIHWSFDVAAGWHLGRDVANYVADNFFLPVAPSGGRSTVGSRQGATALVARKAGKEQQETGLLDATHLTDDAVAHSSDSRVQFRDTTPAPTLITPEEAEPIAELTSATHPADGVDNTRLAPGGLSLLTDIDPLRV